MFDHVPQRKHPFIPAGVIPADAWATWPVGHDDSAGPWGQVVRSPYHEPKKPLCHCSLHTCPLHHRHLPLHLTSSNPPSFDTMSSPLRIGARQRKLVVSTKPMLTTLIHPYYLHHPTHPRLGAVQDPPQHAMKQNAKCATKGKDSVSDHDILDHYILNIVAEEQNVMSQLVQPEPSIVGPDDINSTHDEDKHSQPGYQSNPTFHVSPGMTFMSFLELWTAHSNSATDIGMKPSLLAYDNKGSFKSEQALQLFGTDTLTINNKSRKIPRSGKFYCTEGKDCPFFSPWHFDTKKNAYVIRPFIEYKDTNGFLQQKTFTMLHNHELDELVIDGYILIKRESDLTPEEYDFIASNALTYPRRAKLKHALEYKCGRKDGRDYCRKLLARVINRILDQHFRKDRHQLQELRKTGNDIIARGGVWEEDSDDRRRRHLALRPIMLHLPHCHHWQLGKVKTWTVSFRMHHVKSFNKVNIRLFIMHNY
jgi:hypothetical protein